MPLNCVCNPTHAVVKAVDVNSLNDGKLLYPLGKGITLSTFILPLF